LDDEQIASSTLLLTLDDEIQFRCAGFVQAEMERYSEATKPSVVNATNGKNRGLDDDSEDESTPEPAEDVTGKSMSLLSPN
jgi:cohesin complex subunit SA-1/2